MLITSNPGRAFVQAEIAGSTYFHRYLGTMLRAAFKAGLVLDAMEELAFPSENAGGNDPFS